MISTITSSTISVRELFARFPWLKDKLWGGELWGDGYFVRSVGDQVTSEIFRRHIIYQHSPEYIQLELWEESS
jgi:REP element-mobilizing transposase RayT